MVPSPSGRDVQLAGRERMALLFYHCYNRPPQTEWFKNNTNALSYRFVGQKSQASLTGLNQGIGCILWRFICLFQFLKASCIPWLMVPFLHLQSLQRQIESFLHCRLSGPLQLDSALCFKGLLIRLGPHG